MARFGEVFRCLGMDEDTPSGVPGMVVAKGGSNFVALLDGKGLKVRATDPTIEVKEVDASGFRENQQKLRESLAKLTDKQAVAALTPPVLPAASRIFQVFGPNAVAFDKAEVRALDGPTPRARMRVAVVPPLEIKIAIRNLQVRQRDGTLANHAQTPCVPADELVGMNFVWTPQTNIRFVLVPSEPAVIDLGKAETRAAWAAALGLKSADAVAIPSSLPYRREVLHVYDPHLVPGADITFLFVDDLRDGDIPNGVDLDTGIVLIAKRRTETTFAHEAGHYLGGDYTKGEWDALKHTWDADKIQKRQDDVRYLMRDGGAGWKIPFGLVDRFRGFRSRKVRPAPKARRR
ncbi:hypothetical protein [Prosthecomicrobium sp. N25]|uniref:hypothetical protein n=1 Tax=Prosthecomicrobium sp. N25 TaxID=3129254 RepID=UPI0030780A6E